MDSVVGIDLSGLSRATKGQTALAQLTVEDRPRLLDQNLFQRGQRHADATLVRWIEERGPQVVAIDAPLTLPHGVVCIETGCPRCELGEALYTERDVDQLARRQGGGMPFVMLAAIAFRGIYLARKLRDRGFEVIEVYPAAAYRAMGATGKTYQERAALLAKRVGEFRGTIADEVDAVCSALVAVDYAASRHGGVIRGEDGEIWLTAPR